MLVKVGPRGQITIPKKLRDAADIRIGGTVLIIEENGHLKVEAVDTTIFDLIGSIPAESEIDFDKLREETKEYVTNKVLASMQEE